jgi:hypothetical protein
MSGWLAEIQAKCVGRIAFEVLAEDQTAAVIGTTSQGVFVRSASGWVIFCSFDAYRGPLTVTFAEPPDQLRLTQPGSLAVIASGRLMFPTIGVSIQAQQGAIWQPAPVSSAPRPVPEQLSTLAYLAREAVGRRRGVGFSVVLPHLLELPERGDIHWDRETVLQSVLPVRRALCERDVTAVVDALSGLLGVGGGLTPSGDDFIMGLLLVLNRWRVGSWPHSGLRRLNQEVTGAAYQRTTRLSANMIECAALGEADERLVAVADCIFVGDPPEAECVSRVLGWGASSGTDALTGMAVAVTC